MARRRSVDVCAMSHAIRAIRFAKLGLPSVLQPDSPESKRGVEHVLRQLLPALQAAYDTEVEELSRGIWWGRTAQVQLRVTIFCEDPARHVFSVHVSSSVNDELSEVAELDALLNKMTCDLQAWGVNALEVHQLRTA